MVLEKQVNVLLTGASGLLGRAVYKYLSSEKEREAYPLNESNGSHFKWNCLGLCHSRVRDDLRQIDLCDFDSVDKLIDEFQPDVILHCAAEKRVENVEQNYEKALQLNKGATEHLAEVSAKRGILFIYISTDYVFDGTKPPYRIDDQTNPLNKYGTSKLNGEIVTKNASTNHCIVRVPVLYGFTEPNRFDESAVNVLIGKVRKSDAVFSVDHVQTRFPTHCIDVARFCTRLIQKHFQNADKSANPIRGVLHCSSLKPYTKYEMSCAIADQLNLPKDHIQPDFSARDDRQANLRPDNAQLDTAYSYELLDFEPIMDFQSSIKECLEKFAY